MSLNGLDHPAIAEAYQSALADAGGWFLLHYTTRDEVALLDRGSGGVSEVRNAIDKYEVPSPLYGFLQYRRRKVILRYMPEGMSRLIQARSNVQFQSVTDKFTPNDSVLQLTQASELNESALSSACLLHTASGSITSSSSSLRRRRLREITEDAEENGTKEETKENPPPPRSVPRQRSGSQMSEATIVPPSVYSEIEKPSPDLRPPPSRGSSRAPSRGSPSETHTSTMSRKSPDSTSGRSRYRKILDEFPRPSDEVRMSTQSGRPSLRDLERAAGIQPKVKLGPRPSVDQSGRPRTSGTSRDPDERPVASLPAGMRPSSVRRSNAEIPRPRSQGSSFASRPNSRAPPIPPLLIPPPTIPISRPQLSPGAKSLGALSTSSGLTPEKERLMKALQQRKKQMAKRAEDTKKKKQSIAEEPKAEEKTARSQQENKENIDLAPNAEISEPEELKQQPEVENRPEPPLPAPRPLKEEAPAEPQPEPASEPQPEPASTPQPEPASAPQPESASAPQPEPASAHQTESASEPQPEPASAPQPEPTSESQPQPEPELQDGAKETQVLPVEIKPGTTDVLTSDLEGESSNAPASSAEIATSTDNVETTLESVQSETTQPVPEDETRAQNGGSAILDPIETKDNLVPASADSEVPLDGESTETPDPAPVAEDASTSHQPENIPVESEQLESAPVETAPAEAPEPTQLPVTPPADSPPSPEIEPAVAPVSVSIDPAPVDEAAPKEPLADPLPLDQRRRVHLGPIQVPTPEYSDDDNLLSDDSFMEELRSATVHEARPITVKSPNGGDPWSGSRTVSSPQTTSPSAMQALAVGRSVSSSYPDDRPPTPVLVAKKINVSSGISNRIKALEKFSSREGTPSNGSHTVTGPPASSSFENVRKRASVSYGSAESFPRAPSLTQQDSPKVNGARRTNSISVTARIVRDGNSPGSNGLEPSESDVLNLQASPLTVEHRTAEEPSANGEIVEPTDHSESRRTSVSSAGSGRQTAPVSRPGSRLSLSSRSKTDETLRSASPAEEKKESRASRLMRRMSSITSTSRLSIVGALGPPVKEEDSDTVDRSAMSQSPSRPVVAEPIDIGEVNVQFPETLLWKRRFMRIDENGYLVLTSGTNDASARNMTKRYHLTEFRTPCLPDEDMQELPNSILLEFLDGSTLQCACESRQGQSSALQTLVDAHNAHQQ